MDGPFEKQLQFGNENEDLFRAFVRRYWGYAIIHTSRLVNEMGNGGSRLYLPHPSFPSEVPLPDFLCIRDARSRIVLPSHFNLPPLFFPDLKAKRKADYYRNRSRWETGISLKPQKNYLLVQEVTGIPVWVFHLIYPTPDLAMNEQRVPLSSRPAPTGLFGCSVSQKANTYGNMVYWGIKEDMVQYAELQDILKRGAA